MSLRRRCKLHTGVVSGFLEGKVKLLGDAAHPMAFCEYNSTIFEYIELITNGTRGGEAKDAMLDGVVLARGLNDVLGAKNPDIAHVWGTC